MMMKFTRLAVLCTLFTPAAAPLTIDTYNPQEKGILPSLHAGFRPERSGAV
jgi:hypothetical protein